MSDEHACCCSDRKRQRTDEEYKRLMNRLSRIEGQIRGVKGMLENDAYSAPGVSHKRGAQQLQ